MVKRAASPSDALSASKRAKSGDDKAARKASKKLAKQQTKVEALRATAKSSKSAYKANKADSGLKQAYKAAKAQVKAAEVKLATLSAAVVAATATATGAAESEECKQQDVVVNVGTEAAYREKLQITTGEEDDASSLPPCFRAFNDAPFASALQDQLKQAGFASPSPIQAQGWPIALAGDDLIAVAKTGSGKTLGFLLPVFHAIAGTARAVGKSGTPAPKSLVLSPTRELAVQIQTQVEQFGKCVGIKGLALYGGTPAHQSVNALKSLCPAIVVATPGRLVDMIERKALKLKKSCVHVVLDEADRMLDMGFEPQIKAIFAALPEAGDRQTLLFSATWPKSVRKLAANFLRKTRTKRVFIGASASAELEANKAVTQTFIYATDDEKDKKLYDFLCTLDEKARIVVFANTKRRVQNLSRTFWHEGFGTCAIHGDKTQAERDSSLKQFSNNECPVMFATDVVARGLDIKGVTHVINFDMARDVESYVHRIGRTGRAGELGDSVTFWNPDFDKACTPALIKIAEQAGQPVPDWLAKYAKSKASKQWKVAKAVLN